AALRASGPEVAELERTRVERGPREVQIALGERVFPSAVAGVAAELALQVLARERLLHAAADMRLALLEDAAVPERHAHVTGVSLRIEVVRVHDVAHLGREREDPRIAHSALGEGLEPRPARHERDRDVERRAELRGVVVRGAVLAGERL